MLRFAEILNACGGLSGGVDCVRGWWVAHPKDVTLPPEAS
jgi:hypothetical protein